MAESDDAQYAHAARYLMLLDAWINQHQERQNELYEILDGAWISLTKDQQEIVDIACCDPQYDS